MKHYPWKQVKDAAGHRVRGLWLRNGRFYLQTTVKDPETGFKKKMRKSLPVEVKTLEEAKLEALKLKSDIQDGHIKDIETGPTFKEFRVHYRKTNHKAKRTVYNENSFLMSWEKYFGSDYKIRKITAQNINGYRAKFIKTLKPRSINLHVKALKQMLLLAKHENIIESLPFEGIKQIKVKQEEAPLITEETIKSIQTEAITSCKKSGKQFSTYISFLMNTGSRCSEALQLKWSDIDWENKQIVYRAEISKGKTRRLDFHNDLETLLLTMKQEAKSKTYLFPSNRTNKPVTSFKTTLEKVREKLKINFHFHLTRHYFISRCIMRGIDYMTIARWVGHVDGGILIGRVYGHLNNSHLKLQAAKLNG